MLPPCSSHSLPLHCMCEEFVAPSCFSFVFRKSSKKLLQYGVVSVSRFSFQLCHRHSDKYPGYFDLARKVSGIACARKPPETRVECQAVGRICAVETFPVCIPTSTLGASSNNTSRLVSPAASSHASQRPEQCFLHDMPGMRWDWGVRKLRLLFCRRDQ